MNTKLLFALLLGIGAGLAALAMVGAIMILPRRTPHA